MGSRTPPRLKGFRRYWRRPIARLPSARLEQLNRALGSRVLAAAEVAAAAPGEGWTDHGEQSLRGRERRVRVFELTGR